MNASQHDDSPSVGRLEHISIYAKKKAATFLNEGLIVNKGRPLSLWIMTIVTLAYLLVEFSFNSRLLDAVGGITSESKIHEIELWGRCLSGFAAALIFWPWLIERKINFFAKFILITSLTSAIMVAVYYGEKSLVTSMVENSTPEDRYAAANLMFLQNALVTNDAKIDGLDVNHEQMAAPDGKAFLVTFPLMLMAVKDIDTKIKNQKIILIRHMLDERYGGAGANFNRYISSLQHLKDSYNEDYLKGSESYARSLADTERQQMEAWRDYSAKLEQHSMTPDSVPEAYFNRVRSDVRSSGVPVSSDWVPSDDVGFFKAVASKVRAETDRIYRDRIIKAVGFYLPPGLSPASFFNHPGIQDKWRNALMYPDGIHLEPGLNSQQEFDRAVYSRVLEISVRKQLAILDSPPKNFGTGGKYEKYGKDSMGVLLAAPIALAFSVLGAVVHVFKTLFFLMQCVTGRSWANGLIKSAVILLAIILMFGVFSFQLESKITAQPIYKDYLYKNVVSMFSDKPDIWGYLLANAIRGTVQIQPVAYPVFESIRKQLPGGFNKFGYEG